MRCSCGAENINSFYCDRCRWQMAANDGPETDKDATATGGRPSFGSILSAAAWLQQRLCSVYPSTPRGFSTRNSIEEKQ